MLKIEFYLSLEGQPCVGTTFLNVMPPESNPNASRDATLAVKRLFSNADSVNVSWAGGQHAGETLFIGHPENMKVGLYYA